jgi:hypothetical protein
MTDNANRPLTPTELAIANGTASTEICRAMIEVLRDLIANHAAIPEISENYFASVSARELLLIAEGFHARASELAGGAVLSERNVRNPDVSKH